MISVRIEGLDELMANLKATLDDESRRAMNEIDKRVADSAATGHIYTSRSGDLQRATVPGVVTGSLISEDLKGEVLGDTPYGQFVEERWGGRFAFLQPAWDREAQSAERDMETAFQRALLRVL